MEFDFVYDSIVEKNYCLSSDIDEKNEVTVSNYYFNHSIDLFNYFFILT